MKLLFSTIFVLNFCLLSFGQAPESFNYQAVVRDAGGIILANQNVNIKILILDSSANGTVLFSETHNLIANEYGLINLQIGTGTTLTGAFTSINWGISNKFIRMEMDPTGGSNFSFLGTSQLLSVPYALYAETSGNGGASYSSGSGISIVGNVISNSSPDQVVSVTGAGATNVSGTYPNYTISSTDNVNDADSNPTNELQTLSQTGTNVTLSNGGGTISVIDGDTSLWKLNGNNIYRRYHNVGIGINSPQYRFHVNDTLNNSKVNSIFLNSVGGSTTNTVYRGFYSQIAGTNGLNRAIQANSGGLSTGENIAFAGFSDNALNNFGLITVVGNSSSTIGSNYGLYNLVNGSSTENAGILSEIGENTNGASNNGIVSYVYGNNTNTNIGMQSSVNNSLLNNIAIRADIGNFSYVGSPNSATSNTSVSTAVVANNLGTGGTTTYGVSAYSSGGSSTNFGVYGNAGGNPPTNSYSIYGQEGSTNLVNYAGYFNGKVTITGTLSNPSDRRLKSNIQNINNGMLEKLLSLNVYSFLYTPVGDYSSISLPTGEHIGLIAQELETVFPQVVNEQYSPIPDTVYFEKSHLYPSDNSTNIDGTLDQKNTIQSSNENYYIKHDRVVSYKSVNYIELIPVLIQGIKEQQLIIENQEQKLNSQDSTIENLQQQLNQLLIRVQQLEKN